MFAHSSMVIPFQCLGTWERGRETVVYLGWEMAGLGNRTLCHSLCHSLCDPDLFPAFLTPPLSWGKWCSSSNPHSILTKSWDTVLKRGNRVWKASSIFCTIGSQPAFLDLPSPACSQETCFQSCLFVDWLSGYIMHNSVHLYLFSLSATSVSLSFLSEVQTQFFSSASLFASSKITSFCTLYVQCIQFLTAASLECIIQIFWYPLSLLMKVMC